MIERTQNDGPPAAIPELSRPVSVDAIREAEAFSLDIEADAGERAALAARFRVPAVEALTARIAARPWGPGGVRLDGEVEAALTQSCVVTLEPVRTATRESFTRYFAPSRRLQEAASLLDSEARDDLDALSAEIDFGEIAAEQTALAIDPYPRADGAAFGGRVHGPPEAAPLTDEAARPFAGLAALRERGGKAR